MGAVRYVNVTPHSLLNLTINRFDTYAIQKNNGGYTTINAPITQTVLNKHINQEITIGTYTLSKNSTTRTIVFDIDCHPKKSDTVDMISSKQNNADTNLNKLTEYLIENDIPHIIELSGSPHSYHVFIYIEEIAGRAAREYANHIKDTLSLDCECFPKNDKVSKKLPLGNLTKLIFGKNRKNGNVSKILIDDKYVSDFDKITIGVLDISDINIPAKETVIKYTKASESNNLRQITYGVRPCVERMVLSPLHGNGDCGHNARICAVREFDCCGIPKPAIAKLFSMQIDYDEKLTMKYINHILKTKMGRWRCSTIRDKCGSLVDCKGCDYR